LLRAYAWRMRSRRRGLPGIQENVRNRRLPCSRIPMAEKDGCSDKKDLAYHLYVAVMVSAVSHV
jgi:hypothetical protein